MRESVNPKFGLFLRITWCFSFINLLAKLYKQTKIDLANPFSSKLIVLGRSIQTTYSHLA